MNSFQTSNIKPKIYQQDCQSIQISNLALFQNSIHSSSYQSNDDYLKYICQKGDNAIINAPILDKELFQQSIQIKRKRQKLELQIGQLQNKIVNKQSQNINKQSRFKGRERVINKVQKIFGDSKPNKIQKVEFQRIMFDQKGRMQIRLKALLQSDNYLNERIMKQRSELNKQRQRVKRVKENKESLQNEIFKFRKEKYSIKNEKRQKLLQQQITMQKNCIQKYIKYINKLD